MARRYELTDEEWDRIKDYIPTAKTGRTPKDHRHMVCSFSFNIITSRNEKSRVIFFVKMN